MTRSEWLPVATSVLVMLLSPLWTTWVSPRLSAANLDKMMGKVARLFTQIVSSPFVLPPLNVVFNSWLIYKYLHASDVVTKKLVFDVSTSVGLIIFSTLQGFSVWFAKSQMKILEGLQQIIAAHHEIIGDLVRLTDTGNEHLETSHIAIRGLLDNVDRLAKTQQDTLGLFQQLVSQQQTKKRANGIGVSTPTRNRKSS